MSQNSSQKLWVRYVRQYYRPALIAWLLQVGINWLILGLRDPVADRLIAGINVFIRSSMADTVELAPLRFAWWFPLVNAAQGALVILLALALGYSLVDSARRTKISSEQS